MGLATKNKKLISINLDLDLIDGIDSLSQKLGISRSALVNMVMRGAVMGETSEAVGKLLGLAIESQKKVDESNAEKGDLSPA